MGKTHSRPVLLSVRLLVTLTICLAVRLEAFPVLVAESPTSDLSLTLTAIRSAKHSLLVNAYELTSDEVVEALKERIASGVKVMVLHEGQPVGGLKDKAREIIKDLSTAMTANGTHPQDNYFLMRKLDDDKKRRFHFDHAKYMVVDDESLLVGSENYSGTGHPVPGKKGNRGWEIFIHENTIARKFRTMFQNDIDTSHSDVEKLVDASHKILALPWDTSTWGFAQSLAEPRTALRVEDFATTDADSTEMVTSPDTSMDGLIRFISSARRTLDLEMMTFSPKWGATGKRSPLLAAVIEAARRGVAVRALLNDETVFFHGNHDDESERSAPKNPQTVKILRSLANEEGLSVQAKIADISAMGITYIHNKGAIVDGETVLISSINWNQNSTENNREAAILLHSREAGRHYQQLFDTDWQVGKQ